MSEPDFEGIQRWLFVLLANQGFELHALNLERKPGGWLFQVFMDHQNGITVDDCATVSRQLSLGLEVQGFLKQDYTLEVSSPGIGQELQQPKDWQKSLGKSIKLYCVDGQECVGLFQGIEDGDIKIMTQQGLKQFSESHVKRAKLYPLGFFDFKI